ncbi:MAG: hypothetical protein IKB73_04305 [Ruminococcus sp.]|nr:hypothetical protein [Ruminococcus sp.]
MIKGINHQVIEVIDPDNRYYERALLVVRPEHSSVQRELLEKEAKKLLNRMGTVSTMNSKTAVLNRIFTAVFYLALGALSTSVIYSLL